VRADAAFSEAANRAAVAFEAAPSVPIALGFWLPTTIRCVPAPSKQGAQNRRRVGRSFGSGILPIWTNRRSPSGALSPLRCRRELIPIPLGQTLCQASAQSSGERQQQSVHHRLLPGCDFCAARTACASPKARLLIKRHGADAAFAGRSLGAGTMRAFSRLFRPCGAVHGPCRFRQSQPAGGRRRPAARPLAFPDGEEALDPARVWSTGLRVPIDPTLAAALPLAA
jgi:hypothetical protein